MPPTPEPLPHIHEYQHFGERSGIPGLHLPKEAAPAPEPDPDPEAAAGDQPAEAPSPPARRRRTSGGEE